MSSKRSDDVHSGPHFTESCYMMATSNIVYSQSGSMIPAVAMEVAFLAESLSSQLYDISK